MQHCRCLIANTCPQKDPDLLIFSPSQRLSPEGLCCTDEKPRREGRVWCCQRVFATPSCLEPSCAEGAPIFPLTGLPSLLQEGRHHRPLPGHLPAEGGAGHSSGPAPDQEPRGAAPPVSPVGWGRRAGLRRVHHGLPLWALAWQDWGRGHRAGFRAWRGRQHPHRGVGEQDVRAG